MEKDERRFFFNHCDHYYHYHYDYYGNRREDEKRKKDVNAYSMSPSLLVLAVAMMRPFREEPGRVRFIIQTVISCE